MSTSVGKGGEGGKGSAMAPLREPTFRRIWTASLFSSFGQTILGVGAAWEMTRLEQLAKHGRAGSIGHDAAADAGGAACGRGCRHVRPAQDRAGGARLFDFGQRRADPDRILRADHPVAAAAFLRADRRWCRFYSPSWQASIGEQVSEEHLPAAVALGTISYNLARSFGPALGGLIVLAFGAQAAFAITASFYIPLWLAFFAWQRLHTPSRLPPERIDRAIASGGRYARHSPPIRTVMTRAFMFGLASAAAAALAPLVARDLLGGGDKGAGIYGILLGASGIGAVVGALLMGDLRHRFSTETVVRFCTLATALALVTIGLSRHPVADLHCAVHQRRLQHRQLRHAQRRCAAFRAALGDRTGAFAVFLGADRGHRDRLLGLGHCRRT